MKIGNNKSSILITSLWIMAILSLLGMGIGFRASLEVRLSKYNMDKLAARYLADAGIVKAQEFLLNDTNEYDTLYECGISLKTEETLKDIFGTEFNKLGSGSFSVYYAQEKGYGQDSYLRYGMMDEERKMNINIAKFSPGNINEFKRILGGLSSGLTIEIINAMIDWQDIDSTSLPGGAEDNYYELLEHPYECKDSDFELIEELVFVKDVTPELFKEIKDYVTVYGDGKININTASRKVLNAVIVTGGRYYDLVDAIIRHRQGEDGIEGTRDDKILTKREDILSVAGENNDWKTRLSSLTNYFAFKSGNFRIISHAEADRTKKVITCIVSKGAGSEETELQYYHEE